MKKLFLSIVVVAASMLILGAGKSASMLQGKDTFPPNFPLTTSEVLLEPTPQAAPRIEIEPELQKQISADGEIGYLVYFREQPDLSPVQKMGWDERGEFVVKALQETARNSQADVRAYLDAQGASYQSFWIDNVILVEKSSRAVLSGLMSSPDIKALRTRRVMGVIEPTIQPEHNKVATVEANIAHVGSPAVWAMGFTGQNVVVSNIDTGVRYTHQALVKRYRGNQGGSFDHNYNWYDPYGEYPNAPMDGQGHGSHTMGTMIGNDGGTNQIGMAPGAKWIACRGCTSWSCSDMALLSCAQFIAAPWDLTKSTPDSSKRPHVVNNSWGDCGKTYDSWYQGVVDNWQALGIFPVFSNGNATNCNYARPPGLGTVGNPARYGNVTGVGASTLNTGEYATFSNWGPTDNLDTVNPNPNNLLGQSLKPQILAPGENIRSSVNSDDSAYEGGWSGTSMAAPHVTGLVALIWSAAPCLVGNYAATENIIENTATPVPYDTGGIPPPPASNVPNYAGGHGEINALAAVHLAQSACGDSTLAGRVIASVSAEKPLSNALVVADAVTTTLTTITDSQGYYTMTLFGGVYTVTASAYGYLTQSAGNVNVISGTTTTQNFLLDLAPQVIVNGSVKDALTGWPLYARIIIDGYPGEPIWTAPTTGHYQIELPVGSSFRFYVESFTPGYKFYVKDVHVTGDMLQDFDLEADRTSCKALGYALQDGISEGFEDGFLPAGWSAFMLGDNNGPGWQQGRTGTTESHGGPRSGSYYAWNNDDVLSTDAINWLVTPRITVAPDAKFAFWQRAYYTGYYLYHGIWITTGASPDPLESSYAELWRGNANENWSQKLIDLSAYAGQDVYLAFRYKGNYRDEWYIDDVLIGNCMPKSGGLIAGNVFDANSLLPLPNTRVINDTGDDTYAVINSEDLDQAPAYYTLFSPSGSHAITATLRGYGTRVITTTVVQDSMVPQDIFMPVGQLSYSPLEFNVSVDIGLSTTRLLTLTNQGSWTATFELAHQSSHFSLPSVIQELPYPLQSTAYWDPSETAPIQEDVQQSTLWGLAASIPTGARYRAAGASCNGRALYIFGGQTEKGVILNESWKYDPSNDHWTQMADMPFALMSMEATCINGYIYLVGGYTGLAHTNHFQIYNTFTDTWTSTTWPKARTPMTAAWDYKLYAFGGNPGPSAETWMYDPITALWTGPLASMPVAASYGGATTAGEYIYVLAGINSRAIWRYDPVTNFWRSGPLLPEGRMNPIFAWYGDYLYVMGGGGLGGDTWAAYTDGLKLDLTTAWPGGTWISMGDMLAVPVVASAYDCADDRIYGAGGAAGLISYALNQYLDDGNTCHPVSPVLPWLSEDVASGSLGAGTFQNIAVTLNAAKVEQPGTYSTQMRIIDDIPYDDVVIPVTMTVPIPDTWGKLVGNLRSLGYCDVNPTPLDRVTISIQGSDDFHQTYSTQYDGYYELWVDGVHNPVTVTATRLGNAPGYAAGIMVSPGLTTTADVDLRWQKPCLSVSPSGLEATSGITNVVTRTLTLINTGAGEATFEYSEMAFPQITSLHRVAGQGTWLDTDEQDTLIQTNDLNQGFTSPKAYRWAPDGPAKGNALIYADDWVHDPPHTFLDEALQLLGMSYTAHYTGDFSGFQTDLVSGTWDVVLYAADSLLAPSSILSSLNTYVRQGGKLGAEIWYAYYASTDPLFDTLGVTYKGYYTTSVPAIYWWDLHHPIFTDPYDAPQWASHPCPASFCGQYVYPVNGVSQAVAGYNPTRLSGSGALILRNDGSTVFKAFLDMINSDDLNQNEIADGAELWANIADGLLHNFRTDVPWLSEVPISGTLAADSSLQTSIVFDASAIGQLGKYSAILEVYSDDLVNDVITVPVTLRIYDYGMTFGHPITARGGDPGAVATYTLHISNTGNITDTFLLSASNSAWITDVPASVGPLGPGKGADFRVFVHIPPEATKGEKDTIFVTFTSQGNPTEVEVLKLETTVYWAKYYLPVIRRN